MKKLNLFLILTLFGFGIPAKTVSAQVVEPLNRAPELAVHGRPTAADIAQGTGGVRHNARRALAPYAQVVPNDSYTFIGISHPSLATAHTSIGLVIEAMDMTFPADHSRNGSVPDAVLRAVAFTINAGETHRVFIVNDGHATINAENPDMSNSKTHLITTAATNQFGNIRITSIGTHPNVKTPDKERYEHVSSGKSWYNPKMGTLGDGVGTYRFDNLSQLSMWGVVYQESNGAGFSLEFIGDMHDSSAAGTATQGHGRQYEGALCNTALTANLCTQHPHSASGIAATSKGSGVGRGIN
jgi:hypothetical protein